MCLLLPVSTILKETKEVISYLYSSRKICFKRNNNESLNSMLPLSRVSRHAPLHVLEVRNELAD
ncbi:hypothetical protein PR048_001663 [Dryococelus australis]|uniref:Uncharacterized protein n=1 Tax=Dryococelus australis TaxID=614101 RepID=A0ABQ9IJD4_9NEOP|nr:hypothetical protein PR048_001663 [Dryococelus australis]